MSNSSPVVAKERREIDTVWRATVESSIKELKDVQLEIKRGLARNNEMTEALLVIFNGTKTFWQFCTKASSILVWVLKKGTVLAISIAAIYHAIDTIIHYDLLILVKGLLKKF